MREPFEERLFRFVFLNPTAGPGGTLNRSRPGLYILGGVWRWFFAPLLASLLGFRNPRDLAREEETPPCPLRRHLFRSVMADRVTIISPRDPWPFSTVTAEDLEDLVAEGLLRPLSNERQPEWIPPASGTAPSPDRKSTRLNSSHSGESRMPSSA